MPELHTGHQLFELARAVVGLRKGSMHTLYDPLHEDLLSEAVVALVAGEDPAAAVRAYRRREQAWGRVTAPLLFEV